MANIAELVDNIRSAVYGEEVRESIAQSIEGINTTANSAVTIASRAEAHASPTAVLVNGDDYKLVHS